MILSRAVEHLRQQHWTAVFIELVPGLPVQVIAP
jgi:hypothetical protein